MKNMNCVNTMPEIMPEITDEAIIEALFAQRPYEEKVINSAFLEIPAEYQRKLNIPNVEKMSAEFTELIANPPKVSYRDGHYFVFDGQHTIVTRRAMNGGQDLPIICKVYEGLTEEEEAMLFSRQTGVSTPLTAGAELRAALVGKDPESLAFVKATESTGLQLGLDSYRAPWKIICIGACLHNHTSYIQNPDKTEQGELVSSYQCSPLTVDEEFLLTKRLYEQTTGRSQKSDVIAYQVRQSFKPGEVTPEEANRIGYEFAERFLKGKHAFIVATHTDRAHIHNHIIYNSTALDGTRKFKNFWLSSFAVQRLSDLICLEHQLSTIEYKPYRERQKRIVYPPKESNRDRLCSVIDSILAEKPKDYEDFLQRLEQQGYEVKRGKHTAVKGARQKRFIRFRTLGNGYGEDEIKAVLEGKAKHQPYQKQPPKDQPFQLLVDIQGKMAEGKSVGYKKWATKFNLKEMSKTLLFLQEQKIGSAEELRERAAAATERYHAMGDSIKAAEARLTEIAVLKSHIINYAKTREVYAAYRKAGYSKAFLEAHREEITLHKAAKAAFDEAGLQKLPKVKELDAEFAELLTKKKAAYPDYRKARNEMQELVRAQKNVERFFAEEKDTTEKTQTR